MASIFFILLSIGVFLIIFSTEDKHFVKVSSGIMFIVAAFLIGFITIQEQEVVRICETEHISYTLVETAADHINCTKLEIAQFFSNVNEVMEPVEALMLLDKNLTEEDALAILQLSDKKQAE